VTWHAPAHVLRRPAGVADEVTSIVREALEEAEASGVISRQQRRQVAAEITGRLQAANVV
jgi:hypothetical protein